MNLNSDVFKKWVKTELNPWRKDNGLSPLDDLDIAKCFDVIEQFHRKFDKPVRSKVEYHDDADYE